MSEGVSKSVYSVCAMCTVRCPIEVEVENGAVKHIWGNPHLLGGRFLCPRGAAGKAFQNDSERLHRLGNLDEPCDVGTSEVVVASSRVRLSRFDA